ncbi:hypothetical protein J3P96_21505 [Pseudomonas sp. R3-56]|uniref:hypothetical protein n=1 Tax=Pseudomonas sp. R3-56 TaxID=2817401 RepID=UPI003DAA096F
MLVSAKQQAMILPLKRPGEDPTPEAASGLQSAALQALRDNVQTQASAQVQDSATRHATQQVSAATAISDKVDEAFAKTRVQLQTVGSSAAAEAGSAMAQFKDYMSKTPEQRLRDSILKEMGITEEEYAAMPPEKQLAVGEEIAQRMQDKSAMAQMEKDQQSEKNPAQSTVIATL